MFYLKLSISGLLIITFYGLVSCSVENINKQLTPQENREQLNETLQVLQLNATNSRSARTLLPHPRTPAFTLRRRQPIKIRARADHFPLRTQIRRVHNGLPNAQPQQQNMRYGYESLKGSKYASSSKGANPAFLNNGKGSPYRPQLLGGHPNSIHVPALSQQYIHNFKASPAFNGQVVVHPATQKQKQQPTTAQQDNAYPKYVKPQQQLPQTAAAAVPPQSQQQQQQPQPQQQPLTQYPDFKQYPIPDQEKMQQYNEQHEKYLQQQKYLTPKNPIAYYQLQHTQQQQQLQQQQQQQQQLHQELPAQQQPQLQQNYAVHQPQQYLPQSQQQQPSIPIHESAQTSNINNVAFPAAASVPPKMYSVYEENDMTELQNNNYQTATYQGLDKEAQEYLRFMNTNEYFLPKKDPNYKQIDEETDKRQYNVLKAQQQQHLHSLQQSQAPTPYQQSQPIAPQQTPYSQPEQQQQQQQIYAPSSSALQTTQYSNSIYSDLSDPSSYNLGNPVSQLYYQQQQDPSTAASSTVVRTSYQTGYNQNQFVVNSQNNKVSKYTVPSASTPSSIVISTQAPHVYAQLRHNSAGNRTPEPLRFEFTERDAMVGGVSYTHAPQGQLRYNALASNSVTPVMDNEESSTVSSLGSKHYSSTMRTQNYVHSKHAVKSVVEDDDDDPEDGDDMQEAGTNLYGRQPVVSSDSKKPTSTTEAPPSEQKDTEEYCERICAIVEDENEEIVCGSDGYMYTSEAQMECYASCLHIDVTIQGKGSCSTR
ncbi:putative mediator of RNA polymerase II transcription subunit 26 [Calliphora vicina]|uniref:putative mediator of RNA polymerase II transcription subunit 26 n=1 Tax=Calliphora vicina TaxID=7373 RepID=UPI00325AE82D